MARRTLLPLRALLWLAVAGLGLATLFARLGRISWFFELFAHFPAQLAAGLLITIGLALLLRQWRPALAGVLVLIPSLVALSYYYPIRAERTDLTTGLRVVSFNVLTSNPAHGQVLDYLAASEADLIFVIETNPAWLADLAPLKEIYPFALEAPRGDNFGMGFYSRHAIVSYEFRTLPGREVGYLAAVVEVDGREVRLFGAHPLPPVGARNATARNTYLADLAPIAAQSPGPTLVLGDLNLTVWSPFFRDFMKASGLRDTGFKRGFQASWRRELPPFAIPIDHILHSEDLVCIGRRIGPNLGSDHRPVVADLAFRDR